MFYSKKLPLAIIAEMKHDFCVRYAAFKGDVQCEKLDPNRLKLSLIHRHKLDVSELVMSTRNVRIQCSVLSPTNWSEIGQRDPRRA
jgi:hypothetical protein